MTVLMFFLIMCAIATLINPFFGLLVTVALIPQALIPALTGSLAGIFLMFTPIKFIGGITFLSTIAHCGMGEDFKQCFSRPTVKYLLLFLIYMVITGFIMPSSFTRASFTVFFSILVVGFCICSLVNSEKRFRVVLMTIILSYFSSAIQAIYLYFHSNDVFARIGGSAFGPNYFAIGLLPFIAISFFGIASQKNKMMKFFLFFISATLTGALISTFSRGGLIGLGFIFIVGILRSRRKILAIFLSIVLLVGIFYVTPDYVWQRFQETKIEADYHSPDVDSTKRRFLLMKAAWEMFLDHPVFGVGVGNYYYKCTDYQPIYAGRAHSMYLEILAEMGFVGFLLFLLMLINILKRLRVLICKKHYLQSYSLGIYIGFFAFLISAIFLHAQHEKALWLLIFMTLALENIYKKEGILNSSVKGKNEKK